MPSSVATSPESVTDVGPLMAASDTVVRDQRLGLLGA